MKKEYEKKKKLVIGLLAVFAICLAGGLCFYLAKIGTPEEPEMEALQEVTEQAEVIVPEIETVKDTSAVEEPQTEETESPMEDTENPEGADTEAGSSQPGDGQAGNGSGKPQTREDAQTPAEKPQTSTPEETDNPDQPPQYEQEENEPDQPEDEPAGGTTNDAGQIYVPGFGYIDDPGAPVSESAGSDGDWNKEIGNMN